MRENVPDVKPHWCLGLNSEDTSTGYSLCTRPLVALELHLCTPYKLHFHTRCHLGGNVRALFSTLHQSGSSSQMFWILTWSKLYQQWF